MRVVRCKINDGGRCRIRVGAEISLKISVVRCKIRFVRYRIRVARNTFRVVM